MWKYSTQIKARWLFFLLALLALCMYGWQITTDTTTGLGKAALKGDLTRLAIRAEAMPWHNWLLVFVSLSSLLLLGIPSMLPFTLIMAVVGFYPAFAVIWLSQVFITRISIHRAQKKIASAAGQTAFSPLLRSLLIQNQADFGKFAFWGRVYFSWPLRTIDALTPMIQPEEEHLSSTLWPATIAIFIRMLLPAFWVQSFFVLFTQVNSDPSGAEAVFLGWSSLLIIYAAIPRIPELFICAGSIRPILQQIADPESAGREEKSNNSGTNKEKKETTVRQQLSESNVQITVQ